MSARKPYSQKPSRTTHSNPSAQHTPIQSSLHTLLPLGSKARSKLKDRLAPRTVHGGDPAKGKRKTARPFTPKAPVHLVLKSTRSRGAWSMLHRKHRARVQVMIYTYAKRFKLKVYRSANVGNHLHLLVKAEDRKNLADFLRVLAGRVAVVITGAEKGQKKIGKFWDYLCWSRLVNWGRDFFQVRDYLVKNLKEHIYPYAEFSEASKPDLALEFGNIWGAEPG